MRISDSGWMEYFGGHGLYWVLFIFVGSISGSSIIRSLKVF